MRGLEEKLAITARENRAGFRQAEETLGILRRLEWTARRRVRGALSGRHTSPEKGPSVEFAEHRKQS